MKIVSVTVAKQTKAGLEWVERSRFSNSC